ncbi:MAG: CHC2 zinc finger domain-containing protein [Bacteroidota bacterium]
MLTLDCEEEIKQKSVLIEVVEDFVTMTKRGTNWVGSCPFHKDYTPSFYVSMAADKTMFKCFGCSAAGNDAMKFLQLKEGLSYPDSLRYLANKYNIPLVEEGSQKYVVPEWKNKTDLSPKVVKWFEGRKISQKTLLKAKVTEGKELMPTKNGFEEVNTMQFNYFRNDVLVNTKFRGPNKSFKLVKGAELILCGLDSLKGKKEAFAVEGEIDWLSLIEAGFDNETMGVVSVPNGASEKKNNLIYLNNCLKDIEHIEIWHLGFDNDINGRKLREDFAERIGKHKCDYIEWKDKKDGNAVLMQYGIQGVIDCCSNPVKFPLEGAFTISDIAYEISDMYERGLDKGVSIGLKNFPLRFVKGYITVVTGIPGQGKSECVDEITLRLTNRHNWQGAFYSPENKPTQLHYSKMASRLVGKAWEGENRITKEENQMVQDYLDKKIWFIKPEKDFSLTSILASIRNLQIRFGLDYFVIDAWNKLEHKDNDTHAVGRALDELAVFCEANNLHCFLVAHPTKVEKDKKTGMFVVPTLYSISGSSNFFNKADNGICVYLDRATGICTWYRQKVKFKHFGWVGESEYLYEAKSGRYYASGYPDFTNWITGKTNIVESPGELPLETPVSTFDPDEVPF